MSTEILKSEYVLTASRIPFCTSCLLYTSINYLRKKIDRDYDVKLIHTKPGMGFIFRQEL